MFYGFTITERLVNSCRDSRDFGCLLTTFANSFDPDQGRQNVGPYLDPKRLIVFLKEYFEKVNNKSMKNYPASEII